MNKSTIAFTLVIIVLAVAGYFSLNLFSVQRKDHDRLDIRRFPQEIGGFKSEDLEVTEKEYKILETRNLINREYAGPDGRQIYLFIIYSETNRSVFHPPEVCLIGSGLSVVDKKRGYLESGMKKIPLNELYLVKDDAGSVVLYCYNSGDLYTDNYYTQQASFTLNQLAGTGRGGATIKVAMAQGPDKEADIAVLKDFLKGVIQELNKMKSS
jgi:EpsI family protein